MPERLDVMAHAAYEAYRRVRGSAWDVPWEALLPHVQEVWREVALAVLTEDARPQLLEDDDDA